MDARFLKFIPTVFEHEGFGKFTDDKRDPGGATKYGISLLFLSGLQDLDKDGWRDGDLNRDGKVDAQDIHSLNLPISQQLYHDYFWKNEGWPKLTNDVLSFKGLDLGVNIGPGRVSWIFAECLMGINEMAVADYKLDADEIAGLNKYALAIWPKFLIKMEDFYRSRNKPEFLTGWLNRLNHFPDFLIQ